MAQRKKQSPGPPREPRRPRRAKDEAQQELRLEESAPLHELAQSRYLNYALSVITSRALPDVRDGLKPVQRRILYTMWQQSLTADVKHRKCAKVVGDVMGSYHPHGDSAIYDALVRMAQPFALRVPLVDGSGNFGSLDGDPAAAMRYTECRLASAAGQLLGEIEQGTVHFRPNYDGTKEEPAVLPARLPNLLTNGAMGIAVGMATNIPPHNPEEVCKASIRQLDALLEGKQLSSRELARTIQGPDFPTGGQIISTPEEIKQIYETGQGSLKVRGTWELAPGKRPGKFIHITSVPYAVNKSTLVESIAELVISRKMPYLLDVRDVSTDDVRIELELKKDADEERVLAFLFKHTPLQSNFAVNLTCLVPTENADVGRPERLDLSQILWHFLHFRLDVVRKRLEHELATLGRRVHVLEGFAKVFDALDRILKLIRESDGRADAAQKIMQKFDLDQEQTDAILELRLYRLARLEILVIQNELKDKRKRMKEIRVLLGEAAQKGLWGIVRRELEELLSSFGKQGKRRTTLNAAEDEREFSDEELIVAEDNHVLLSTDGWVKRQKEIKDLSTTRLREGDQVQACEIGSTRSSVVFFSNLGTAYSARIADIPATVGYGEPIQKLFKLRDGERVVAMFSLDPRVTGRLEERGTRKPARYAVAATSDGYALAFGLSSLVEPSTRAGRRFAKPSEGKEVVGVALVGGVERSAEGGRRDHKETLIAASREGRVLLADVDEVSYLSGPGKGVLLIKLADDDELIAFKAASTDTDGLTVETSLGGIRKITPKSHDRSARGGRGRELIKRGTLRALPEPPEAPPSLPEGKA